LQFHQRALQISVCNSLLGPINYKAERLNVRLGVIDSPVKTAGHSFVSFFFASKRGPPRIFFVTRHAIYFHVSTGSPGCDSWCREHARNAISAKLKLLHEGWRSGFKVSFMGTFNSRPTAFESAHWHRMTRTEILRADI